MAAQTSKSKRPSSEHSMVVPSTAFKSCINGGRGGGGMWNFGGGPGPSHASSPQSKKSLSNIFHINFYRKSLQARCDDIDSVTFFLYCSQCTSERAREKKYWNLLCNSFWLKSSSVNVCILSRRRRTINELLCRPRWHDRECCRLVWSEKKTKNEFTQFYGAFVMLLRFYGCLF